MMYLGLGALLLICGLIFEIMAFTEPSWTLASRIFAVICGLIFLALPLMAIIGIIMERIEKKNSSGFTKAAAKAKEEYIPEKIIPKEETAFEDAEENQTEQLLSRFRNNFEEFFKSSKLIENSGLQYGATQLYWHILSLQKKRLEKKKITLLFSSERKTYKGLDPVSTKQYFDGQYRISELSESLSVTRKFVRDGKELLSQTQNRVAHIVSTSAKPVGKNNIVCPNCGKTTTRENLIDGCDYCGTKFKVQDLENKISAFRLRDSYEIEYEKYKLARAGYNMKVFWGQFAVYFVLMCLVYITSFNSVVESAGNVALGILFIPLTSAFGSGMFAFLGLCLFWVTIFPVIQTKESLNFYSKKRLDLMKKRYSQDTASERRVRNYDPNFSVAAFYSELNNKLACIHFADTKAASEAFFEDDSYRLFDKYKNVVDMDIEDINVTDFAVEDGLQKLSVKLSLSNLVDSENKLKTEKEKLSLTLVKSADCKTETICGPAVFTCKGCGSSLALEKGKKCNYCGRELDLKQYDWVIRDYKF